MARVLRGRGAEVRVLTPRDSPELPEKDLVDGIPVRRIPFPRVRRVGAGVLLARLLGDLLSGRDELLHVDIPGPMLIPAVIAARIRRMPVVLKFHNFSQDRGIWADVPREALRRWPIQAAARRVDGVIAISSRIARASDEGGWPSVRFIPNGIDLRAQNGVAPPRPRARRSLGLEGDPIVLFVGRLSHQKGVDVLLEAWTRFIERRPLARLIVLGEGPERLALCGQAERIGIERSVDFRGLRDDVAAHYAASDLCVFPSRHEGHPIVLLEAMAAGLPVIATRVSGTEDVIEDGRNGLLAPPEEPEELLRVLLRLSGDPVMAARLGAEARKTVEERYDINRVAEETLCFYHHLIDRR
jgi:glycosyltransferase involved in cell wall biosynthesis